MKTDVIPISEIGDNNLCLKAEHYVDPLATEIAAKEARIRRLKAHLQTAEGQLVMLKRKRENILRERRGE